jgi:uncharacterized protein
MMLMNPTRTISTTLARRLAVTRQRLAGPGNAAGPAGILDVVRDLGCLQIDPISAVARSHLLVIWSRLGVYDPADLDTLLWQDRSLFEYWAHAASIVLTEDYAIHKVAMRNFGSGDDQWTERTRKWMEDNSALRDSILAQIRERGPLLSREIEDSAVSGWRSSGWTEGRNVSRMLDFLWINGTLMVAGRKGGQKLWDFTERRLPDWAPRQELDEREMVRIAAQKSLRALGVGRSNDIAQHYIRGRYPGLPGVLADLEAEGVIQCVQVGEDGASLPGQWYVHTEDLPLLEQLENGAWEPRTSLLSPFDNLICDRARTEALFDFRFRIEIYVPKPQRQYGYYVLPILRGDRLIGRIDPTMDRKAKRLTINAIYAEPDAPMSLQVARDIAAAIQNLASFLGAQEIAYGDQIPEGWKDVKRET